MLENYRKYMIPIRDNFDIGASALPDTVTADTILQSGHQAIVSLFEKNDVIIDLSQRIFRESHGEIAHFHLAIDDFSAPDSDTIYKFIKIISLCAQHNISPLVHCLAGNGRTGTLLAAFYIWNAFQKNKLPENMHTFTNIQIKERNIEVDPLTKNAISFIRKKAPHAIETSGQIIALREFTSTLQQGKAQSLETVILTNSEILIPLNGHIKE